MIVTIVGVLTAAIIALDSLPSDARA